MIAWICPDCKRALEAQLAKNKGIAETEIEEYTIGSHGRYCMKCGTFTEDIRPIPREYMHVSPYCGCPTCRPGRSATYTLPGLEL